MRTRATWPDPTPQPKPNPEPDENPGESDPEVPLPHEPGEPRIALG